MDTLKCKECGCHYERWIPIVDTEKFPFALPDNQLCPDCNEKGWKEWETEHADELKRIEEIKTEGHSDHCACRQVWGDGECECDMYKAGYDPYAWMRRESPFPTITTNQRNAMSEESKNFVCPFCGSTEVGINSNAANAWVECFNCHAHGPEMVHGGRISKELEAKLVYQWNRRAASDDADNLNAEAQVLHDRIAEKQQEIDELQRRKDELLEENDQLQHKLKKLEAGMAAEKNTAKVPKSASSGKK